jgi:DNA-binding Lrp family transcriptional regulator
VRNRIQHLEDEGIIHEGVIWGCSADVNYNAADVQYHYQFICTVRVSDVPPASASARNWPRGRSRFRA